MGFGRRGSSAIGSGCTFHFYSPAKLILVFRVSVSRLILRGTEIRSVFFAYTVVHPRVAARECVQGEGGGRGGVIRSVYTEQQLLCVVLMSFTRRFLVLTARVALCSGACARLGPGCSAVVSSSRRAGGSHLYICSALAR